MTLTTIRTEDEINELHTLDQLDDFMMELIEADNHMRSRKTEFVMINKYWNQFQKYNFYFSEKDFVRAYYNACFDLYMKGDLFDE